MKLAQGIFSPKNSIALSMKNTSIDKIESEITHYEMGVIGWFNEELWK
jgi:hypothetical protein